MKLLGDYVGKDYLGGLEDINKIYSLLHHPATQSHLQEYIPQHLTSTDVSGFGRRDSIHFKHVNFFFIHSNCFFTDLL